MKKHNLVVASYDVVRNDIDFFRCFSLGVLGGAPFSTNDFNCFFRNIKFNYCILDEGHVIKNGKTKLSKAIKQLAANFRIILSGTPIQVSPSPSLRSPCLARSVTRLLPRTTSWSSGPCSTSSCPASWERSGSSPPATGNPSSPAGTPRAPRGSRRPVSQPVIT